MTHGRAVGVRLADGTTIRARHGILADIPAPNLYGGLVVSEHLPRRLLDDVRRRFDWDDATLKVNWALDGPIPWTAPGIGTAGTVHLGVDHDGLVDVAADLSVGRLPRTPFVLLGQMSIADSTRSPHGTESAWAYTHIPARWRPGDLEGADRSLSRGAINAGTAALHQQLVLRPTRGLGRPETPITGLYLAGASAHPGEGVHGACGWNAAVAALRHRGPTGALRRALVKTAWGRVLREPSG